MSKSKHICGDETHSACESRAVKGRKINGWLTVVAFCCMHHAMRVLLTTTLDLFFRKRSFRLRGATSSFRILRKSRSYFGKTSEWRSSFWLFSLGSDPIGCGKISSQKLDVKREQVKLKETDPKIVQPFVIGRRKFPAWKPCTHESWPTISGQLRPTHREGCRVILRLKRRQALNGSLVTRSCIVTIWGRRIAVTKKKCWSILAVRQVFRQLTAWKILQRARIRARAKF